LKKVIVPKRPLIKIVDQLHIQAIFSQTIVPQSISKLNLPKL